MTYTIEQYRDSNTGRYRFAVMHRKSAVFYFARRYGKRAAMALCNRMKKGMQHE